MAPSADPKAVLEHLLNAARGSERRFLVGIADAAERQRIVDIVADEGQVVEATSTAAALQRLADESFDLAFLGADESPATENSTTTDPLATWRELRPFSDVVLIASSDPARCAQAFGREVAAVFPRPLPEVEVLLRAHVKRLVASRQVRTRGQLVLNAFNSFRAALETSHPELTAALSELVAASRAEPSIAVFGGNDLGRYLGGTIPVTAPDAVVASLARRASVEKTTEEARERAPGAALILVDDAPSVERLRDAIYGGVRAYLPRDQVSLLGRIAASVAARRRAESIGLTLAECLTRFGILTGEQTTHNPALNHDVDASLIAAASTEKPAPPIVPTGHEVLVVDDEAVVLTVLREALRRGGYRVTTAASAEEAIDLMRKRHFDLVLTDKNLPGASGLDVLRAARELTPAPAIVLITGYSSLDSAVEAMDTGAHDYIEKPIRDVEDLRARVRRALSRRDEQLARPRVTLTGRAGRVLLVEAEGARRRLIADYLGRSYVVIAAEDGDDALNRLQKEHFDLVLADRHLPGVSGLRVIEHARRLLPHCASVLYTAYPSYESVKEAFASGVDAYLVRPSEDLKKLGEKVGEALGGRGGILLG
ncbi:MAG TPA: response regulator [Polyangia bacterium]|jgi:CheY-like chemotaxis protein